MAVSGVLESPNSELYENLGPLTIFFKSDQPPDDLRLQQPLNDMASAFSPGQSLVCDPKISLSLKTSRFKKNASEESDLISFSSSESSM